MPARIPPPLDLTLRQGLTLVYANNFEGVYGYGLEKYHRDLGLRPISITNSLSAHLQMLEERGYLSKGVRAKGDDRGSPARSVRKLTTEGTAVLPILARAASKILERVIEFPDDDFDNVDPPSRDLSQLTFAKYIILHSSSERSGTNANKLFDRYTESLGDVITGSPSADTLSLMAEQGLLLRGDKAPSPNGGSPCVPYAITDIGKRTMQLAAPLLEVFRSTQVQA